MTSTASLDDLLSSLSRTSPLSKPVQKHLTSVYTFLSLLLLSATAGCYVHLSHIFHGGFLSMMVGAGLSAALAVTSPTYKNNGTRRWLATGAAFCQGLSLGPLLSHLSHTGNTSLIFQALSSSTIIFGSFSLASYMASQRVILYTVALLGSLGGTMAWLSLWNVFMGSRPTMAAELYLGLALVAGYIVVDTQLILARAERGIRDVTSDAFTLFVDAVQLFVRVLVLLAKNREEKDERERKRSARNRR
ncbi:hypothetical protein M427DRAFT_64582 [Gonapodya prolifera JEL478]|uniref:Bax inhibitor family protein n=1 Tax=Gonapodya prolifera (strain JEL478) TaxID=1344416 RepID=A0A138ZXF8_GONPJ|nr:hypothetical protein M427DRAFT_64582 [Gonapodya prolifera JEL478]|eukprot:KXS09202.1 hypothetical protein M427DRAFT_64582 [Gonapodya prolifera JEL478]